MTFLEQSLCDERAMMTTNRRLLPTVAAVLLLGIGLTGCGQDAVLTPEPAPLPCGPAQDGDMHILPVEPNCLPPEEDPNGPAVSGPAVSGPAVSLPAHGETRPAQKG